MKMLIAFLFGFCFLIFPHTSAYLVSSREVPRDGVRVQNEMTHSAQQAERRWWEQGVVFQVYPRSFKDSNGDGIGDIAGLTSQMDYFIHTLPVDAIWLSPVYRSPMKDFGYDVSNYTDIEPMFGTLKDFDDFISKAHSHGIKVILDFVPNHTSDQHEWFKESSSSRSNAKRDWYIWKDPAPGGGPPNNWLSNFGGSAWKFSPERQQYYYHAFLEEQPDLNWRNPEVQDAMMEVLRFWLKRGVDGFRVDVIWHLIKDDLYRNNPPNPNYKPHMSPHSRLLPIYSEDRPEVHEIVAKMRRTIDEFPDRMMIGEAYLSPDKLAAYYGMDSDGNEKGCNLPFNFQLIWASWKAQELHKIIQNYYSALPARGWPNWVLGNHDNSRISTRVKKENLRSAEMLLLTLHGTPTLYYGDEIGMEDVPIPPHRVQDPFEKRVPGQGLGRDPERTPMQWDHTQYAGFSSVEPWLPLAANSSKVNVAQQVKDPHSHLSFVRELLALRKREPGLSVGAYHSHFVNDHVLAYRREEGESRFLVVLNLSSTDQTMKSGDLKLKGKIELSTLLDRKGEKILQDLKLRKNEGLIIRIESSPGAR